MNTETESSSRPLRVAVVSAVFPPEFTYSSRTSGNVAEQLAAEGEVVTGYASFPSKPAGQSVPGGAQEPVCNNERAGLHADPLFLVPGPGVDDSEPVYGKHFFRSHLGRSPSAGRETRRDLLEHLADICDRHGGSSGQAAPDSAGVLGSGYLSR